MGRPRNQPADIWRRIAVGQADECWPFTGSLTTSGYGTFSFDGERHQAHRVTYTLTNGPIRPDLHLDHLCRNRRCCNPAHLEPVTCLENIRRSPIHNGARTHCPKDHPYAGTNLRIYRGGRYCRECIRIDARRRKQLARESKRTNGLTTRGTKPVHRPQSKHDNGPGCPGPTH
jgi:hypothetical protein